MSTNILWSIATVAGVYLAVQITKRILNRAALSKSVPPKRIYYIEKVFEVLYIVTALVVLAFIWSVDFKGISLFASSIFAVIGVALFAQWSILSNVTSSIIIFFTFPAKVGDRVKIIDGDNSVEGTIREITLFQIELQNSEGDTILYPNNLLLQKPVVKLKADASS